MMALIWFHWWFYFIIVEGLDHYHSVEGLDHYHSVEGFDHCDFVEVIIVTWSYFCYFMQHSYMTSLKSSYLFLCWGSHRGCCYIFCSLLKASLWRLVASLLLCWSSHCDCWRLYCDLVECLISEYQLNLYEYLFFHLRVLFQINTVTFFICTISKQSNDD